MKRLFFFLMITTFLFCACTRPQQPTVKELTTQEQEEHSVEIFEDKKFSDMSQSLPPETKVSGVLVLPDGTPWIYGNTGIFSVDQDGQAILIFDQPVWDFQGVDQSGRVWVLGEGYQFIACFDGQDWQVFGPGQGWDGLPDPPYLSKGVGDGLAHDSQGRIWIATGSDVLKLFNTETNTWQTLSSDKLGFPPYQNADYQGYLLTDSLNTETGQIWISACIGEGENLKPFGIWQGDGKQWEELKATNKDCVLDMANGLDGVIWAGGFNSLLKFDSRSGNWTRIDLPPYERSQIISRININPVTGQPWVQVIRFGGASIFGSLAYYHLGPSGWVLDMESTSFSEIGVTFEPNGTAWMCGDGQMLKSNGADLNVVAELNLNNCQISIDGSSRIWIVDLDQSKLWMSEIESD